jgi:hypothetical protein
MSELLIPKLDNIDKLDKKERRRQKMEQKKEKTSTTLLFGLEVDSFSLYLCICSIIFLTVFFYLTGLFKEMKKDFKLVIIFTFILLIFVLNIFTAPIYSFNYRLEYSKLTDIQQQLLVLTGNLIIYIFISIYLLKSTPTTNIILFTILIIEVASLFSLSVLTEGVQTRNLRQVKQNNLNICVCLLVVCFYFQLKTYL